MTKAKSKTDLKTFNYTLTSIMAKDGYDDSVISSTVKAANVIAAFDAVVVVRDALNSRNHGKYFIHSIEESL